MKSEMMTEHKKVFFNKKNSKPILVGIMVLCMSQTECTHQTRD